MAPNPTSTDRWKALDFGPPPSGLEEPGSPVLVDYVSEGQVALITLNRPTPTTRSPPKWART